MKNRPSPRCILFLFILLFSHTLMPLFSEGVVRIGSYDNPPKIYRDQQGNITGFIADITRAVLEKADLDYQFIHGTWLEGLGGVEEGTLDVMVDVAYSEERAKIYRFNEETVFINWGVVYARQDLQLENFLDLEGLTVAGMEGGIHSDSPSGLLGLARQFNLNINYLPVKDYEACFQAVEQGRADAAVVNRIFGLEQEGLRKLKRTNVFFNPIAIKYAFNRESPKTDILIPAFDKALRELKADQKGVFYSSLGKHLPGFVEQKSIIPTWLRILFPTLGAFLALSLVFILLMAREINRRRILESRLLEAKEAAESANQAKTNFLSNTSHEIRTPMNAILGYAQILQTDPGLGKKQKDYIEKIIQGGEHLLSIINEILDMSRIEAGRTKIEESSFDIQKTTAHVEAMIRERARVKGLDFYGEIDPRIPRHLIGDEGKINQILINLLGNAVKFTREGGISLYISREDNPTSQDDTLKVNFLIKDTGAGISKENISRIFDPFEQIKESTLSSEGTGLGLSISRKLARLMGGDITVSSTLGAGSEFLLSLPLRVSNKTEPEDSRQEEMHEYENIVGLKKDTTLLIADDRESNRDLLVKMLEPYGFAFLTAVDGREAFEIYEKNLPEIVLLDLVMPIQDGLETLVKIRQLEKERSLGRSGVAIITASTLDTERGRVLAAGADDFIRKPFRISQLLGFLSRFTEFQYATAGGIEQEQEEQVASREIISGNLDKIDSNSKERILQALTLGDVDLLKELGEGYSLDFPDLGRALIQTAKTYNFELLIKIIKGDR